MSLVALVRAGDVDGAADLALGLSPVQRRALLPELKVLRKELAVDRWGSDRSDLVALLVAGVACNTSPAAAASWLTGRNLRSDRGWGHPALWRVFESQPEEWQTAAVAKVAARPASAWWPGEFDAVESVVRRLGCPVPTSDGFVTEWHRARTWNRSGRPPGAAGASSLWLRLAGDSFVPVLAPRLFDLVGIGPSLFHSWGAQAGVAWADCLKRLAEEGVLDRGALIDRNLARLLRGGRQGDQRAFLKVLQLLAPTRAENTAHLRDHLALLGGESTVAAYAQQVLTDLDGAGLLPDDLLAEASATVLFRSEKKLVRAQLGWLDRVARHDPARAGAVLLAAADAFGHPDPDLQERALRLTVRHLKAAGDAVLPELRFAAETLNPAHAASAAEILGTVEGTAGPALDASYAEVLPPVPPPDPMPEPLGTAAEVAEEVGAVVAGDADPMAFERALDGLVRHGYQDRAALAEALEPVLRVHDWHGHSTWWDCDATQILYVAAAVSGQVPASQAMPVAGQSGPLAGQRMSRFGRMLAGRLQEAGWHCMTAPRPFLLATPTSSRGSLDAGVLVRRLAAYEALDLPPGPADLSQALLRVAPTDDPAVLDAAAALLSPAGQRLARWLKSGGLPHRVSRRIGFGAGPGLDLFGSPPVDTRARTVVELPGVELDEPLAEDAMRLLRPHVSTRPGLRLAVGPAWASGFTGPPTRLWPAMLPHHREELAALLLERIAGAADEEDRGAALLLPDLAEAEGPAATAVHLAVGYGLGARFAEDRAAAVDALLVLAARGDLDGGRLGRELAELVRIGSVKPNRLTESLRAAADTGAYGTVWSVLDGALPLLLTGDPVRGAGELLAIATDCARRSGGRGGADTVAAVTEAAGRGGSGRLVRESRVLRELLPG